MSDISSFGDWLGQIDALRQSVSETGAVKRYYEEYADNKPMKNAARDLQLNFKGWLESEQIWNGTALPSMGTDEYLILHRALEYVAVIMPNPCRSASMHWMMQPENAVKISETLAKSSTKNGIDYNLLRANLFEAVGNDLASAEHAGALRQNAVFANEDTRSGYLTRNKDGVWQPISASDVAKLMRSEAGKPAPHVIMTSAHAFLESIPDDLEPITKGYTDLARKCAGNDPNFKFTTVDDPNLDASCTVMIAATDTRENNFLNLADLFRRLHDIEAARTQPQSDRFEHISPIAVRMTETILKSVVDGDPDQISFSAEAPPVLQKPSAPLTLRADAADIVRNMVFVGFSKGGNSMRDAMRFLVHQLVDHPEIIQASEGQIRDIVTNLSVTVKALNERPMDERSKDFGVQVPYFSNEVDIIAPRPEDMPYRADDETYVVSGFSAANGHSPKLIDVLPQFPVMFEHFKGVFAGCAGKAAITHLRAHAGDQNRLTLEVAPATTDAMMNAVVHLLDDKLKTHRVKAAVVRVDSENGRSRYEIQGADLLKPGNLEGIKKAIGEVAHVASLEGTAATHWRGQGDSHPIPLHVAHETIGIEVDALKRARWQGHEDASPYIERVLKALYASPSYAASPPMHPSLVEANGKQAA